MREQHKAVAGLVLVLAAVAVWYVWPERQWIIVGIGAIGISLIVWGLTSWHQIASIQAAGDADLVSAIYYVAFGKWNERPDPVAEPNLIPSLSRAKKQVLQRALYGDLPVWGTIESSENVDKIPKRFWKGLGLDLSHVILRDVEGLTARPRSIQFVGNGSYTGLKTSKAVVEKLWRKPITKDPNAG